MNSSTEVTPAAAETESPSASHPGRARGQRLEITSADITMFSAIVGREPSAEERDRALNWGDGESASDDGVIASASAPVQAIVPMRQPMRFWHPASLSLRMRELWFNGFEVRVNRPQISAWLKRFSAAIQQGSKRVRQVR
jgi:hypothetical protein